MQGYVPRRSFTASSMRSVCLLANSRQADLIGSKIIQNLRKVSGDKIIFTGYGGEWMKREGFDPTYDIDIDAMADKTFHTYRKTKTANESLYYKWNPLNLINKHYVRETDDALDRAMRIEVPRRIYQSRPDLILNIDNEYMTLEMMDELKSKWRSLSHCIALVYLSIVPLRQSTIAIAR